MTGKWIPKAVPPNLPPASAAATVFSNPDLLSSYFHSGHLSKGQRDALAAATGGKTQTTAEYKKRCRDQIANELNLERPIVKEEIGEHGLYLKYKDCIFKIGEKTFLNHINNFLPTEFHQKIDSFFYFYEGTESHNIELLRQIKRKYLQQLLDSLYTTYAHYRTPQLWGTAAQPILKYEDFIHLERLINGNPFFQKPKELYYVLLSFLDFKKSNVKEKAIEIVRHLSQGNIDNAYYQKLILYILKKIT
ncbi:MAG: hypothetical protein EBU93_07865 [Chlamydiae bacterium]|nr:hypothetical protein [Chlamydiota bacterium]